MINKITDLLKNRTKEMNQDQKKVYLKSLGHTWSEVLKLNDQELHKLEVKIKNELIETDSNPIERRRVDINGSWYLISQPKGNKLVNNITWSNKEVCNYLKNKL